MAKKQPRQPRGLTDICIVGKLPPHPKTERKGGERCLMKKKIIDGNNVIGCTNSSSVISAFLSSKLNPLNSSS
jgi:hypothetical protein